VSYTFCQNELSAILRFGAEELFKEDKTDEETKKKLESMDIDEILERAEKVETKGGEGEEGNELLSAFKVANFSSGEDDATFWSRLIQPDASDMVEVFIWTNFVLVPFSQLKTTSSCCLTVT
jgi:chromodomain-helicase-DNA-binding protein 1